jgi:hypothetical protein
MKRNKSITHEIDKILDNARMDVAVALSDYIEAEPVDRRHALQHAQLDVILQEASPHSKSAVIALLDIMAGKTKQTTAKRPAKKGTDSK